MISKTWHVQYDDDWKRRDVLGIHPQRQEGLYWVGALIPVGRLQSDDMDALADVAERLVTPFFALLGGQTPVLTCLPLPMLQRIEYLKACLC